MGFGGKSTLPAARWFVPRLDSCVRRRCRVVVTVVVAVVGSLLRAGHNIHLPVPSRLPLPLLYIALDSRRPHPAVCPVVIGWIR